MAVSTAMTHNSKILVALNGDHLFLTQPPGSAGGSAPHLLSGIQANPAPSVCNNSGYYGRGKGT